MIKILVKTLILRGLWVLLLFSIEIGAQTTERAVTAMVSLDTPVSRPLSIEVSVRNHGFVVIPPTFTIIRPILDTVAETQVFEPNQVSSIFAINGISSEAVDYTVRFRCIGCADIMRTQYFTFGGTRFGLVDEAYIDPDELPVSFSVTLQTLGKVSGQVQSEGGSAERSMGIDLRLIDGTTGEEVETRKIVLQKGQAVVAYTFNALDRSRNQSYKVEMRCATCQQALHRSGGVLDARLNHEGIDFRIAARSRVPLSGVIWLLLEN